VTYLANGSGGTDAAYRYDPFGRWLAQTGPYASANVMRFSSKPWVAHNGSNTDGLYYYGYRFYDPLTQRWLNRDPLEEQGGVNLYGFVMNNPIGIVDAHGLVSVPMPPNPSANACCEAILEFLKQLTRHVRARYNDLLADKMFLYKYDPAGWKNHIKKFEEQQERLEEWIEKFKKKCPGGNGGQPVPVWILVEADREAPKKPLWAERTRHWSEYVPGTPQQIETVGVVSGVVGNVILVGTGVGAGTAVIIRGGVIRIGGNAGLVPVY
jgi:RHS repeat-associated protein